MAPELRSVAKLRVICTEAPVGNVYGSAETLPMRVPAGVADARGFSFKNISVIVASDEPVFFTFITICVVELAYALDISNFSVEVVNVPVDIYEWKEPIPIKGLMGE